MTWFKFSVFMAVIYIVYYGVLILFDLLRDNKRPAADQPEELTFVADAAPVIISDEPENQSIAKQASSVISSGGVLIKEIFKLAQEEAIEYIRPVSF